jgi:hypothetical protein
MMKAKDVYEAYQAVKDANLFKMNSADQFKVIKALRALKAVSTRYEEEAALIDEKCVRTSKEDLEWARAKYQEQAKAEAEKATDKFLPKDEWEKTVSILNEYGKERAEAIKAFNDEEVKLDYDKLTDELFEKFLESNDKFTASQSLAAYEVLV